MKRATLELLAPLLNALRDYPQLREAHPGTFLLHGKNFLHFHHEESGVYADVLMAQGMDSRRRRRVHIQIGTDEDQAELLELIDSVLSRGASGRRPFQRMTVRR